MGAASLKPLELLHIPKFSEDHRETVETLEQSRGKVLWRQIAMPISALAFV